MAEPRTGDARALHPRRWLPDVFATRGWPIGLMTLFFQGVTAGMYCLMAGAFFVAQHYMRDERNIEARIYERITELQRLEVQSLRLLRAARSAALAEGTERDGSTQRYRETARSFEDSMLRLRELAEGEPAVIGGINGIRQRVSDWQSQYAGLLDPAPPAAPRTAMLLASADAMDGVGQLFGSLRDGELDRLAERQRKLHANTTLINYALIAGLALCLLWTLYGIRASHVQIARPLKRLTALIPRLSGGETALHIPYRARGNELGGFAHALEKLREVTRERVASSWVKNNIAELSGQLQQARSHAAFGTTLLRELAIPVDASFALLYRWHDDALELRWCAGYGLPDLSAVQSRFQLGEGLPGQCARDRRLIRLDEVPIEHFRIVTGMGSLPAATLILVPLQAGDEFEGVMELAFLHVPAPEQLQLLQESAEMAALIWQTLGRSLETLELLKRTSQQAQELKVSEEALRQQTEELRIANTALEERTAALGIRQAELEDARHRLEAHARELELASRYKSEFLANMSHELRTPLNSLLILSKALADNEERNLSDEQVESARTVHDSGQGLLRLINEILDLSKIEAGKMPLSFEDVDLRAFSAMLERNFRPVAESRGLVFSIDRAADLPASIHTDGVRLGQIVANFLSNAFKFTRQGSVRLCITRVPDASEPTIAFSVTDTGMGIAASQQQRIFLPFEQGDSGTSRRYGGTGLGLSIARGMASLLGGTVQLLSEPGQGATFTLLLPERTAAVDIDRKSVV